MAEQFIYHMRDLKKVYPGGKEVLRGIHLSFYPGAKIGVIGGNGSGKSTTAKLALGVLDTDEGAVSRKLHLNASYVPQKLKLHQNTHRQTARSKTETTRCRI